MYLSRVCVWGGSALVLSIHQDYHNLVIIGMGLCVLVLRYSEVPVLALPGAHSE